MYPSLGYYFIKTDGKYYDAETMEQLVDYKPTAEPMISSVLLKLRTEEEILATLITI